MRVIPKDRSVQKWFDLLNKTGLSELLLLHGFVEFRSSEETLIVEISGCLFLYINIRKEP